MAQFHVVKENETPASIAALYEFGDFKDIFEHPANRDLRKLRPNPHCLLAGDLVQIPEKYPRVESCAIDTKHRFILKTNPACFRLQLADQDGLYQSGKKYELTVGDQTYKGRTFIEGQIQHYIAPDIQSGTLEVWYDGDDRDPTTLTVRIGNLDPAAEPTGIQQRLKNLGFYAGDIDGDLEKITENEVLSFCATYGIEAQAPDSKEFIAVLSKAHEQVISS